MNEVETLRSQIASLQGGKKPESRDAAYLRRRLSELQRSADQKDTAADSFLEGTTVLSVSMHGRAKLATKRIAEAEGDIGVSELVRRALLEYAAKHGYKSEVENFEHNDARRAKEE